MQLLAWSLLDVLCCMISDILFAARDRSSCAIRQSAGNLSWGQSPDVHIAQPENSWLALLGWKRMLTCGAVLWQHPSLPLLPPFLAPSYMLFPPA